jgi:hypothetical protein
VRYSLSRDEELIEFHLAEVIGAEAGVVVAHDRCDSVALVHAARRAEGRSTTRLEHLVLSNGNIFLSLSNLIHPQQRILDAQSWSQIVARDDSPRSWPKAWARGSSPHRARLVIPRSRP